MHCEITINLKELRLHGMVNAWMDLMSVVIKFDGLIFKFGDGRQGKTRKQNGICIATDAVGI